MIAIGAGGLDIAMAMAGKPFYLTCPKVIKVNLKGKLKPFVSAKDVILTLLKILTTKGNVGFVVEYAGEGVKTLSVPERATITNMGAELGVTTSVFPSDEVTIEFLKAQKREGDFIPLKADDDAQYEKTIDINLDEIIPMCACPHSPDNIRTVKELAGKKVDQVLVGSCTNSSFRDLMIVAGMLKERKVCDRISFGVAPGSRQVLQMIAENGALLDIIKAGARILETTCGFCVGVGQAPKSSGVSIRTSNRNFKARSGTEDAELYLVSPETAIACALKGEITDPTTLGISFPEVKIPPLFNVDDSMILEPYQGKEEISIIRGPNIGEPPKCSPLKDTISGRCTIKVGDKITTDHIMPAGVRLKYRSNIVKYADFVFENVDSDFSKRALANKEKGIDNVIVAGLSYGQGSSREHAAICPMYLGVKAVIAKSFERIHSANLINFGVLPLTFKNESDYENISLGDEIEISNLHSAIKSGSELILTNQTSGIKIPLAYNLSERQKSIILAGGLLVS